MNEAQFSIFDTFRKELKAFCSDFNSRFGDELAPLQKAAALKGGVPEYPLETPVVYNTALDELSARSLITKIVIGDNPGKNEQLACNQKYLVGQAGKLAAGFFEKNPEFNTDFRKNVIILNKTPVHSAKTGHLKEILKNASPQLKEAVNASAVWMAQKTAHLHQELCRASHNTSQVPELWLVGYAELKGRGLFLNYRDALKKEYFSEDGSARTEWNRVFVFQHFSMNRFTIDLGEFMKNQNIQNIKDGAEQLGTIHKLEIFK